MAVRGNAEATVSWIAPVSDGGSPITGYVVTRYVGVSPMGTTPFNDTLTTHTITGLTNGTTYRFKVQAVNAIGTSAFSGTSNPVIPATVPDAPGNVFATGGNASATISWDPPASNGGIPVTGYVVTPLIDGVPQTPVVFNSTATTQTVTGLINGTTYTFTVAAINGVGTGPSTESFNSVTPATVPDAPTIGSATAGIEQATVSWTAPASDGGSPITGYIVTPYVDGVAQTSTTFNDTVTTQTVTGLTNGTTYRFRVQAFNGVGTSGQSGLSNSITAAPAVPDAPVIGTATAGNTEATLTWTAPVADGGSPVIGYEVVPYIGTVAQPSTVFNDTATTQTVTGLANGTTYTFTVAAFNELGFGGQSAHSNAVIPATVPDVPTIGTATAGNTQVTLTWTAPVSDGGRPVTGYVVTPYISSVAQSPVPFNSTSTTQIVTGLANGTTYTFTVAAVNAVGTEC